MARPNLDVFVFGVARSGTTMIYGLLQRILGESFEGNLQSTYEPFLWNVGLFDDLYRDTRSLFQGTSSLGIEGIYRHLRMRMFVERARLTEYRDDFYRRFADRGPGNGPHVVKLIRANGRMAVFRGLNPDAKFVLVIRNPIDNVNSVKNKFSFYGDDFYPSDFQRFCDELGDRLILSPDSAGWAEKHAEYSLQMNVAALRFASGDSQSLIFDYDHFVRNRRESVATLCAHLDVEFREDYLAELDSPVGAQTPAIELSEPEYRSIAHYEDRYEELCSRYDIERVAGPDEVHARYRGNCRADSLDPRYQGVTTERLRAVIREKGKIIDRLERQIAGLATPGADSAQPDDARPVDIPPRVDGGKGERRVTVAMHNTRLFPKNRGAAVYRITGIAARCDWVVVTDTRGEPQMRRQLASQPRIVFLSMHGLHEALPYFRAEILPRIKNRFVLVTGSEDVTIPNQLDVRWRRSSREEQQAIREMVKDERLIHWFIENRDEVLPKTSSLPVGYLFQDGSSHFVEIVEPTTSLADRRLAVLCAHRSRGGAQWEVRRKVTELCRERFGDIATVVDEELSGSDFLARVRRHPFVLCVQGGGLDPSPTGVGVYRQWKHSDHQIVAPR